MSSNIYRFSLIGETLKSTVDELMNNYGVKNEIGERILEKFDELANKNICKEINNREKEKYNINPAHITGTEIEFKFHDGELRRSLAAAFEGCICEE